MASRSPPSSGAMNAPAGAVHDAAAANRRRLDRIIGLGGEDDEGYRTHAQVSSHVLCYIDQEGFS